MRVATTISLIALALCTARAAQAQVTIDLEGGWVAPGYNDVRIPGDGGTEFSLTEELSADGQPFVRARLTWRLGTRHALSALWAPLALDAEGTLDRDILFEETTFPAGTPLAARYRFNSYRLSWRYLFHTTDRLTLGAGLTAKVRDALVSVSGGGMSDRKTDLGLVPLINVLVDWRAAAQAGLLLEGDALAAPQGRAIDLHAAAWFEPSERVRLRLGYRVLEGGADNDEVYNFALFHYAAAGVSLRW